MAKSRSSVISSFTIIKGSLIDETYAAFQSWDLEQDKQSNLRRIKERNVLGAKSAHWLRDVAFVLSRRFDPGGRSRPLVELAIADCDRDVWKPLLLFHMTRDEFLVRDFLVHWLYPQFTEGAYRLHADDVATYLTSLSKKKDVEWSGKWTDSTTSRVASGLLRMATDFDLLTGTLHKEFTSYQLARAKLHLPPARDGGRGAQRAAHHRRRRLAHVPDGHVRRGARAPAPASIPQGSL